MSSSLVSILIPSHNSSKWLAGTLESALQQTYRHCEVIVVDDGSTDESAIVAEGYAQRGVRVIRQPQRGAAAARNTALRHAQGDYVQYLDADDLLHPAKIAEQIARLESEPPGRVASGPWGGFYHSPEQAAFHSDALWRDAAPLDWLALAWTIGSMMPPAAWLTPRDVADRAGNWNEELTLDDDGEYFCRVLLASSGVCFCPAATTYYRRHASGNLSASKTPQAWISSHRVCCLVQTASLAKEESPRLKHACAMNHLRFAFRAWPYARDLARASLAEAHRLDPTARVPGAGPRFNAVANILGWRAARMIQHHLSALLPPSGRPSLSTG